MKMAYTSDPFDDTNKNVSLPFRVSIPLLTTKKDIAAKKDGATAAKAPVYTRSPLKKAYTSNPFDDTTKIVSIPFRISPPLLTTKKDIVAKKDGTPAAKAPIYTRSPLKQTYTYDLPDETSSIVSIPLSYHVSSTNRQKGFNRCEGRFYCCKPTSLHPKPY